MRIFAPGLLCVCAFSANLLAFDFSAADRLFKVRGTGPQAAALASQAYTEALAHTSGEEKIYAAVQIGRLSLLQGVIYEAQIPIESRKKALESCIDSMESIKGTRQEYYYFALSCIGARGKLASNLIDKFIYARKMSALEAAALKSTRDGDGRNIGGFEAGGIFRVMAALRGNPQARAVGLYKPEEAIQFANIALASKGGFYPPFTEFLSGQTYWDNHYYLGQAMIALALEKEDKGLALQGRQKMLSTLSTMQDLEDEGALSLERQPEMAFYRSLMAHLSNQVKNCMDQSAWASCLKIAMGE